MWCIIIAVNKKIKSFGIIRMLLNIAYVAQVVAVSVTCLEHWEYLVLQFKITGIEGWRVEGHATSRIDDEIQVEMTIVLLCSVRSGIAEK